MRRCAAAPLPRAWTTMQLVAQASFRCYAAAPSATEQRSNGATERSCAAAARTLWHGATERGAAERSCAAAARSTGTEVRSRATEHGATEGSCAAAAKAHGARSGASEYGAKQFRGRMFHPQCDIPKAYLGHKPKEEGRAWARYEYVGIIKG